MGFAAVRIDRERVPARVALKLRWPECFVGGRARDDRENSFMGHG